MCTGILDLKCTHCKKTYGCRMCLPPSLLLSPSRYCNQSSRADHSLHTDPVHCLLSFVHVCTSHRPTDMKGGHDMLLYAGSRQWFSQEVKGWGWLCVTTRTLTPTTITTWFCPSNRKVSLHREPCLGCGVVWVSVGRAPTLNYLPPLNPRRMLVNRYW